MSTGLEYVRTLNGAAFVLLLALCHVTACGGAAYLPRVGPVPLRFISLPIGKITPAIDIPATPAVLIAIDTNAVVAQATSLPATNSLVTSPIVARSPGVTNELSTTVESNREQQVSYLPAETPLLSGESLIDFFKPAAGRNKPPGVAVTLPLGLEFTPPQPKHTESSSAIYKSE